MQMAMRRRPWCSHSLWMSLDRMRRRQRCSLSLSLFIARRAGCHSDDACRRSKNQTKQIPISHLFHSSVRCIDAWSGWWWYFVLAPLVHTTHGMAMTALQQSLEMVGEIVGGMVRWLVDHNGIVCQIWCPGRCAN